MKLYQVVFLLPLFLTSSLTLTLPGTSEIITTPRNGTFVGSECHCEVGKRLTRQRPRKTDCANAIRQLRDNDIHGDFHSDGIMNQWQLPETKAHGTCNVTVEMKEGIASDETSWLGVSNAAAQLNTACVGTAMFSYLHGGYTYTGRYDGIKIVIMSMDPQRFEVDLNGTVISAESNITMADLVSVD